MSAQSGEGTRETGLHAELEALRREVAELRARRVIAATPSIIPSSMQMSRMLAPFSTCCRAMATASSTCSWPTAT